MAYVKEHYIPLITVFPFQILGEEVEIDSPKPVLEESLQDLSAYWHVKGKDKILHDNFDVEQLVKDFFEQYPLQTIGNKTELEFERYLQRILAKEITFRFDRSGIIQKVNAELQLRALNVEQRKKAIRGITGIDHHPARNWTLTIELLRV